MTDKTVNTDKQISNEKQNKEDEELSALLDSALEDFNIPDKSKEANLPNAAPKTETKRPDPPFSLWNEEFLQQARLDQSFQSLFSPGADGILSAEQLSENIQKLAEAATQGAGFDASPDVEFCSIIAQTLKNLSENTENLQSQLSDENMMNFLSKVGNVVDPSADGSGLLSVMQQMMQNLLSKEILYPALASTVEKYPEWLKENKSKLSESDFGKYSEQYKLMKEICEELEKEQGDDSQEVKTARFDKVLGLMQKIQEYGQPPTELVGDLEPLLGLDEFGNPQIPTNFSPNQCSLM